MPSANTMQSALESLPAYLAQDPGLVNNVSSADLAGGQDAARLMNDVLVQAIVATGANDDGILSPGDLYKISAYVRSQPALYAAFVEGHGDDEGNVETGFHLVQGDGGTLKFQGRAFVNTVADAIYHFGFNIKNGRFRNEDGNANEEVADVAGWMNYFLNGVNVVWGTGKSETLHSGTYSEVFADAADETFNAGGGNDKIWAGTGDDIVNAGSGNDESAGGEGNDTMKGQSGADKLWGNEGADSIYGGNGRDRLGGGDGDDYMSGGSGNDKVWGGDGADKMYGGNGKDVLGGGSGNDWMNGGSGNDKLWGNGGADRIIGADGNDTIGGDDGADILSGWRGNDVIYGGQGDDKIYGGRGNDKAYGSEGDDYLRGASGKDQLHGGDGDDVLSGGSAKDTLYGGNGSDVFEGGTGADLMKAWESQAAADTFIFNVGDTGAAVSKRDVIEGFESGMDKLDFTDFGGLAFIGADDFAGDGQGQLRFDDRIVSIDADGDGVVDHSVSLKWVNMLEAADFIL